MKKMIGVFDSGKGGWYTLQEIKKLLPDYDYMFFGDTKHMPYGDRHAGEIQQYTFAALKRLFEHGCQIVIVACNTAAAYSIRDRQKHYPHKKTLSVTIPGIEAMIDSCAKSSLLLSTTATAESGIMADLAFKYHYQGSLTIKPCPGFADKIENKENNIFSQEEKTDIIQFYVGSDVDNYDTIVLACTHYGLWYDDFLRLYPRHNIIDPSQECAKKLQDYLCRHPEIEHLLSKNGTTQEHRT